MHDSIRAGTPRGLAVVLSSNHALFCTVLHRLSASARSKPKHIRKRRQDVVAILFSVLDACLNFGIRRQLIDAIVSSLKHGLVHQITRSMRVFCHDLVIQAGGFALLHKMLDLSPLSYSLLVASKGVRLCFQALKRYMREDIIREFAVGILFRLCIIGGKQMASTIAYGGKQRGNDDANGAAPKHGYIGLDGLAELLRLPQTDPLKLHGQHQTLNIILM